MSFTLVHHLISTDTNKKLLDFSPSSNGFAHWLQKIQHIREQVSPDYPLNLFSLKAGFTNRIVFDKDEMNWETYRDFQSGLPIILRTKQPSDGVIVHGEKKGIVICNGDCPTIALWHNDRLAVLHAGYRTLIREAQNEENIIEVALRHFNPSQTYAWIGHGIGPCCWLFNPRYSHDVQEPNKHRHTHLIKDCLSKTTKMSPHGAKHTSFNLFLLIQLLLMENGIAKEHISMENECTCCARVKSLPRFWSHTRFQAKKQETDGRNLSLVFLLKE